MTQWYYGHAFSGDPQLAQQYLTPTDDSAAPLAFASLLKRQPHPEWYTTEYPTSNLMTNFLTSTWEEMDILPDRLHWQPFWNASEKDSSHSSRSQKQGMRPDLMIAVNMLTLLLAEDKHASLQAAFGDLQKKHIDLCKLHYQGLPFLMGYAAAGVKFQWCILPANVHEVSCPVSMASPAPKQVQYGNHLVSRMIADQACLSSKRAD